MDKIREQLIETISNLFNIKTNPEIVIAPEDLPADFATNIAMQLAKDIRRSPLDIAEEIKSNLNDDDYLVEVARPGFLNFQMKDNFFLKNLNKLNSNFQDATKISLHQDETIICEFSDPNPFKVLHVGHLFTTVIGDAIARLHERSGAKVIRANFGGDVGMHVAKTMFILQQKPLDKNLSATEVVETIAKCYVEGTRAYEDDPISKHEIIAINKFLYQTATAGESAIWPNKLTIDTGDGAVEISANEIAQRYWWGRKASYDYFDEFYDILGLKFDKYYPESSVMDRGVKEVQSGLEKGVFEKSNGAIIFPGEKYNLHTRVFINSEGLPTYEAKDFGLGFTKWSDYHFDANYVITGNDIIDYMKVIFKAEELVAPEIAKRSHHIAHGNLKLSGGVKMSSRKGNFVTAEEVITAVRTELKSQTNSDDLRIALAAIKFAFLKNKLEGNTNFDIKGSVQMNGASGTYLQYSAVRAGKILAALSDNSNTIPKNLDPHERKLIKKLCEYRSILEDSIRELAPHKICGYLYELSQEFSRFYENCKVVGDPRESLRGQIVHVYHDIMIDGLNALGITVPEKM